MPSMPSIELATGSGYDVRHGQLHHPAGTVLDTTLRTTYTWSTLYRSAVRGRSLCPRSFAVVHTTPAEPSCAF